MAACDDCGDRLPAGRSSIFWGLLLFVACPCHFSITGAGIVLLSGGALSLGWVYAAATAFSLLFVVAAAMLVRAAMRSRDAELRHEACTTTGSAPSPS